MFRPLIAAFATVAGLTIVPATTAAAEHPANSTTTAQQVTCTANDFTTGECLTAVTSGSMAPLLAAVSQAIDRGHVKQARYFVAQRGRTHHDAEQAGLERMIARHDAGESTTITSAGQGTVSGYKHTLIDYPTYLYCGSSSCTQVGKLRVDFETDILSYPQVLLWGEVSVVRGPNEASPRTAKVGG